MSANLTTITKHATEEEVSAMPAIERAKYFYLLKKEMEGEAKRYGEIAEQCYMVAFREGTTKTEDGLFELIVSNADGVRVAPDKDKFFAECPQDAEEWFKKERDGYMPALTKTSLEEYARTVKGLKGTAVDDYIRRYSFIIGCQPSFRAKLNIKEVVSI